MLETNSPYLKEPPQDIFSKIETSISLDILEEGLSRKVGA